MAQVSISVFAADRMHLEQEVQKIQQSGADLLHIDVMDGRFVPMIGLDTESIGKIAEISGMPMDIHLMTCDVERHLKQMKDYPAHAIWLHVEAENVATLHRLLEQIRKSGVRCGLAVSPETNMCKVKEFFPVLDEILLMSTEPGRSQTVFQESAFERLRKLDCMVRSFGRKVAIAVDGGLNVESAKKCIRLGADKVVIGRSFFQSDEKSELIRKLHECRVDG